MKTDYLLHREADRVLAALTPVNRAACKVALHTGLRIGDVLKLRLDQLKPVFSVVEAKTGKRRRVGLTAELLAEVRQFSRHPHIWAFPGRDSSKPLTRQAVWKDVKRAGRAFRLPQNVAPHSFRKIYAVDLLAKYGDVKRVQRALNHRDAVTTYIYAMSDKLLGDRAVSKLRGRRSGRQGRAQPVYLDP